MEELWGMSQEEIERLERRERAWIGIVTTICLGLLFGSIFLVSLSYRLML